jgi:predicted amidophosphoribosyltransferase
VAEDPLSAWDGIYCLRDYNPYWFGGLKNPHFTRRDGRLLDFKEGKDYAVTAETAEFAEGLKALKLPKGTILAIVPGHEATASNEGRPLALVAHALAVDGHYEVCVNALIRTKTISKLAKGGDRSVQQQLATMSVSGPETLKGKTVVILDDTVTTEGSLIAARALVSDAGAAVAAVGLARTVKYY